MSKPEVPVLCGSRLAATGIHGAFRFTHHTVGGRGDPSLGSANRDQAVYLRVRASRKGQGGVGKELSVAHECACEAARLLNRLHSVARGEYKAALDLVSCMTAASRTGASGKCRHLDRYCLGQILRCRISGRPSQIMSQPLLPRVGCLSGRPLAHLPQAHFFLPAEGPHMSE